MEFLETFESHHNAQSGDSPDYIITRDEFVEYYQNVSNSIDDDKYFEVMMNNCWRMNDNTTKYNEKKGWGDDSTKNRKNANSLQQSYNNNVINNGSSSSSKPVVHNAKNKGFRKPDMNKSDIFNVQDVDKSSNYNGDGNKTPSKGSDYILQKFRDRLLSRGAKGIIGLARQFKIFDDNNNHNLEYDEFLKACKDFKVDITTNEIKVLFNLIDTNGNGMIDYEEFLYSVRGEMNDRRKNITLRAFKKLDADGSGVIDINEIKTLYNCKNHPDVRSGKKSEEDVYGEFLETFEMNHQNTKGIRDRKVTQAEFLDYYSSVSCSIDSDEYYETMITNAWNLDNKSYGKSWKNDEDTGFGSRSKTPTKVRPGNDNFQNNVIGNNNRSVTPDRSSNSKRVVNPPSRSQAPWGTDDQFNNKSSGKNDNYKANNTNDSKLDNEEIVIFRNKLAARGSRGIMGIRRSFAMCDDDNSKTLSFSEFSKFCSDYRMGLDNKQVKRLFTYFDSDGSGEIDYEEFLHGIIGEMNGFRKKIVKQIFERLDQNKNGILEVDDLRGIYNAKNHPDVRSGKKTEDEILGEFLDTFEHHFSLLVFIITILLSIFIIIYKYILIII